MNLPSFLEAWRSLELVERRSFLVVSFPLQTDALLATSAAPCCQGAQVAREYLDLLHLRQPAHKSAQKHQCGETGRLCACEEALQGSLTLQAYLRLRRRFRVAQRASAGWAAQLALAGRPSVVGVLSSTGRDKTG